MNELLSPEVQYMLVVVGLFIVPRALQRFGLPSAVTCVGIGAILGMGFHLFHEDHALPLLGTLGIVSLFLFAGLEVDLHDLRRGIRIIAGHLAIQLALIATGAMVLSAVFGVSFRAAILLALALLTPSTGFILDSLQGFGLTPDQQYWVKTKAIASELVALAALFVTVQSSSLATLGLSSAALAAMVLILPAVFRVFAQRVLPFAPKSEFAFLVIVALLCAFLTRRLGVYYLVGAFVVGVTAIRLRQRLPALASDHLLSAVELFATFFIPFYFFKTGLHLQHRDFSPMAFAIGLGFAGVAIPLRTFVVAAHRRFTLGEPWADGVRVGLSLVPTLVFTIVLADILRERFGLPKELYGALIVFTLVNTGLPALALRVPPPEFDTPEAPRALARLEGGPGQPAPEA